MTINNVRMVIKGGAYKQAIGVLYAVACILKMSYKTDYKMEGFFLAAVIIIFVKMQRQVCYGFSQDTDTV